jgi:flagellum-specific peptidoglycan hydrolase FlgJ
MTREQRLAEMAAIAAAIEDATSFPATALLAQWAAESLWGARETGACNVFGLTRDTNPDRPQAWCRTTEYLTAHQIELLRPEERARITSVTPHTADVFKVSLERQFPCFDSLQQASEHYAALIMSGRRFAVAWSTYRLDGDVEKLLRGIAKAGYATGPGYGNLLTQIAGQANVRAALAEVREKPLPIVS